MIRSLKTGAPVKVLRVINPIECRKLGLDAGHIQVLHAEGKMVPLLCKELQTEKEVMLWHTELWAANPMEISLVLDQALGGVEEIPDSEEMLRKAGHPPTLVGQYLETA